MGSFWSEWCARGSVDQVFIGHLSVLKFGRTVDALLPGLLMSCLNLSFLYALFFGLGWGSTFCGPDGISWVSCLVTRPCFDLTLRDRGIRHGDEVERCEVECG
jgi:hypothetical protein